MTKKHASSPTARLHLASQTPSPRAATFLLDMEAMVDRMVPWLPTSAMASFLNMGKKGRLNSVSKTEFSWCGIRTTRFNPLGGYLLKPGTFYGSQFVHLSISISISLSLSLSVCLSRSSFHVELSMTSMDMHNHEHVWSDKGFPNCNVSVKVYIISQPFYQALNYLYF